jgi:hypothetical protein
MSVSRARLTWSHGNIHAVSVKLRTLIRTYEPPFFLRFSDGEKVDSLESLKLKIILIVRDEKSGAGIRFDSWWSQEVRRRSHLKGEKLRCCRQTPWLAGCTWWRCRQLDLLEKESYDTVDGHVSKNLKGWSENKDAEQGLCIRQPIIVRALGGKSSYARSAPMRRDL